MAGDKIFNASDEEQVANKNKSAKLDREQYLEDLRNVMNSKSGQRVVRNLLIEARFFKCNFTGNSHTFFLEGHRNFGLKLFGDLEEACPEKLHLVLIDQEKVRESGATKKK